MASVSPRQETCPLAWEDWPVLDPEQSGLDPAASTQAATAGHQVTREGDSFGDRHDKVFKIVSNPIHFYEDVN